MDLSTEPVAEVVPENGAAVQDLLRRVQALEAAVARLEDPRRLEDRIAERLAQVPTASPPTA